MQLAVAGHGSSVQIWWLFVIFGQVWHHLHMGPMSNQSINIFNVLGGNWDPTDKKFSSVNSYRQDLLPKCKAFPKETTTCI